MGCGSSRLPDKDSEVKVHEPKNALQLQEIVVGRTKRDEIAELCGNHFFEEIWKSIETPMLVCSFEKFKAHGQVPRSSDKLSTPFLELPAHSRVVFVSHRWLRPDEKHPDDVDGSKHELLCQGVAKLAGDKGWQLHDTFLWMDFFSVEQDDRKVQAMGIASLRAYAAACNEVIIPCFEDVGTYVDWLPGGYGKRAWTRLEALTFYSISALAPAGEKLLYACVSKDGAIQLTPQTNDVGDEYLPSRGELFSEGDREAIRQHEEKMMSFLSTSLQDPEMCFRFLAKGMLAGRGLSPEDGKKLLIPAVDTGLRRGLEIRTTYLSFFGNEIGPDGAKAVATAWSPKRKADRTWAFNGALNILDISGNRIGDEGVKAFAASLEPRQNPDNTWVFNGALVSLHLGRNEIGAEGAKALAAALEPRQNPDNTWVFNGALAHLWLGVNKIGDEGAKALAAALEPRKNSDGRWVANGALKVLRLGVNHIGAEGAKALAAALEPRQNPNKTWAFNGALNNLDLYGNNIGAEGAKALAAALKPRQNPDKTWVFNGALKILVLEGNNIGDEGAKALAAAMEPRQNSDKTWVFNGALNNLDIAGNKIGDEGAKALAAALQPRQNPDNTWVFNGALKKLDLWRNDISVEARAVLTETVEKINTHREGKDKLQMQI